MDESRSKTRSHALWALAFTAAWLSCDMRPSAAADAAAVQAHAGVDLAGAAARAWAADAFLVYLENDEPLDAAGGAERWGYLFFSPALQKSRAYSIRGGKIVVAEDLEMKLEAPPIAGEWIDSGAAFRVGQERASQEFHGATGAHLETMLLMRGAFHDGDPDETTWTLVYDSPGTPSLFVVVSAVDGSVRRTWRG